MLNQFLLNNEEVILNTPVEVSLLFFQFPYLRLSASEKLVSFVGVEKTRCKKKTETRRNNSGDLEAGEQGKGREANKQSRRGASFVNLIKLTSFSMNIMVS